MPFGQGKCFVGQKASLGGPPPRILILHPLSPLALCPLISPVPFLQSHFCITVSDANISHRRPTIKVEFAVLFNSAGRAVGFNQMLVSKKLLKDHSEYFQTMLSGPMWKENRDQCVVYDDISMAQFNRLYQFILAGAPAPRISLGRAEHAMRNLLDVYLLADRFGMPVVLDWINESIADAMAVATNWRKMYTQTVLDGRVGLAAINFHDLKAMDWANFYLDVKTLPGHLRPVRLMDILNWIIDNAPGEVIQNVWPNFPGDFQRDLALAYVTKYMATRV